MQKILLSLLAFFARNIILFHKPKIIGITGTVGKTTVTSHVHGFLAQNFPGKNIGYSLYHYNGEYGLPLTIIGAKSGGKNPFKWIWVFMVAISRLFYRYHDILILEYGIDRPYEMDFLLSIAIPDIAILTEIAPNHLEQFGSFEEYRAEKYKLAHAVGELIVHESLRNTLDREAFYYGNGGMSTIDISEVSIDIHGTHAQVHSQNIQYELTTSGFGSFHLVNLLPLYALCEIYAIDPEQVAVYAKTVRAESGRSNMLRGLGGSTIIDGSYNGGYLSLYAGIESMRAFLPVHKIYFVIGDMRELGKETENLHIKLAHDILDLIHHTADVEFYLVGPSMRQFVFPILQKIFPTQSHLSSRVVGDILHDKLSNPGEKQAMIYIKGSQNTIFLEEAIIRILESPEDISQLCRQSPDWMVKKEVFFQNLK